MKLLIVLLLCLQGCTAYVKHDINKVEYADVGIMFIPVDEVWHNNQRVAATASWLGDTCVITMDRQRYTHSCLGHELRHCLEGYWHDERAVAC